jgi:hypothetical protein
VPSHTGSSRGWIGIRKIVMLCVCVCVCVWGGGGVWLGVGESTSNFKPVD